MRRAERVCDVQSVDAACRACHAACRACHVACRACHVVVRSVHEACARCVVECAYKSGIYVKGSLLF
jgi:hypothetical protein